MATPGTRKTCSNFYRTEANLCSIALDKSSVFSVITPEEVGSSSETSSSDSMSSSAEKIGTGLSLTTMPGFKSSSENDLCFLALCVLNDP